MSSAEEDPAMETARGKFGVKTPAVIFYKLFEDPFFFSKGYEGGIPNEPLRFLSTIITSAINLLIIVATVALCMETMQQYDPRKQGNEAWGPVWHYLEIFCVIMFSADFATRFVGSMVAARFKDFYTDPMNYVDFFAISPFYLSLILDDLVDLRFMRVLRLSRILRALKSPRFANMAVIINKIVLDSAAAMTVPIYFMFLAMIMLSFLVYLAEEKENAGEFGHIGNAIWWCVATFTTVGYGDLNPETGIGQVIGSVSMIVGLFFLAMPLSIVGGSFHVAWTEVQAQDVREEAKLTLDTAEDRVAIVASAERLKADLQTHVTRIKELVAVCESIAPGGDHWEDLRSRLTEIQAQFSACYEIYLEADEEEEESDGGDTEVEKALALRRQKSIDSKTADSQLQSADME